MQDTVYKFFILPGNIFVAFAGDVENALEAVEIFTKELEKGLKPITAFERVLSAGG